MAEVVLKADGVSKKFARRIRHNMFYGTLDVGRGMLGLEARTEVLRPGEFWAVDDVSFELKRGETLGLIGPNGSGKSTLLRLLNGIYQPDKGRIEIRGRVGALIAVGAGFHPLMTGRENIYLNGSILGMAKAEIDRKFDSIVEFADIGEFLDAPVKTYSTGMHVRLGFAIAIHCEPDILLVDEILAVGDAKFQRKCFARINALSGSGTAIILVTHNMDAILRHTKAAMLLETGRLSASGGPVEVANRYYALLSEPSIGHAAAGRGPEAGAHPVEVPGGARDSRPARRRANTSMESHPNYNPGESRYGDGRAELCGFELLDEAGRRTQTIYSGDYVRFVYEVTFNEDVERPMYGFTIRTKDGIVVYANNTWFEEMPVEPAVMGKSVLVEFSLRMNLIAGDYFITAGIAEMKDSDFVYVERRLDLVHFTVYPRNRATGIVDLSAKIRCERGTLSDRVS